MEKIQKGKKCDVIVTGSSFSMFARRMGHDVHVGGGDRGPNNVILGIMTQEGWEL